MMVHVFRKSEFPRWEWTCQDNKAAKALRRRKAPVSSFCKFQMNIPNGNSPSSLYFLFCRNPQQQQAPWGFLLLSIIPAGIQRAPRGPNWTWERFPVKINRETSRQTVFLCQSVQISCLSMEFKYFEWLVYSLVKDVNPNIAMKIWGEKKKEQGSQLLLDFLRLSMNSAKLSNEKVLHQCDL